MTFTMLIVVVGWGYLLDLTVKNAAREVGVLKVVGSPLRMFCWVPIVAMAGILFPRIFFPRDLVLALKQRENGGQWFSYIRLGSLFYLVLLFGIPICLAVSGYR
jgi:hypothetical protein